jgi:serine-type D-Ala-D-Ala carboxypeptidase/endopeptidase (penicillin-binding protein 4)
MIGRLILLFLIGFSLIACSPQRKASRILRKSTLFQQAYTGYKITNLSTGKTIAEQHAERYFRPGSNVKLLTLYTCLHVLPDSLVAFQWTKTDSATIYQGMGDPSFRHPMFEAWQSPDLPYRSTSNLFDASNWHDQHLGSGWMWDDLHTDFSAPKSAMPVFGNTAEVILKNREWALVPPESGFILKYNQAVKFPLRQMLSDTLLLPPVTDSLAPVYVPFWAPDQVSMQSLKLQPSQTKTAPQAWQRHYATPIDTVLRFMMQTSDNFFAEQLLLQCAALTTDTLRVSNAIAYANKAWFSQHKTAPYWVDGSGLSHYNLLTPEFINWILTDLWKTYDHDRLTGLFAAGGLSGTITNWYAGPDGTPFVFAKTGTLRGLHSLSGYLRTKKGNWLAFSFMHNNYIGSSAVYKKEMERVLVGLWERC